VAILNKGLMYGIIHRRLKDSIIGNEPICRKQLFTIFGKVYHIPKSKKYAVMRELEELKMIRCERFGEIKIMP
jgi:hypothetical protein